MRLLWPCGEKKKGQKPVLKIFAISSDILDFQSAVFVNLQSLTLLLLLHQPVFVLKLCSTVMGIIL